MNIDNDSGASITTINSDDYHLDYQPASYWGPQNLATHFGSRIKGELRRENSIQGLGDGFADARMLQPSLEEAERIAVGRIHPMLMGGEYLPDLYSNEVEIARVVLQSTTMDVTSLRARHTKHRIVYRIVDEYEDMDYLQYSLKPQTSKQPLRLSQVINLINKNDLIDGPRDFNYDNGAYGGPEQIYDFATASSAFYPELANWFDGVNQEWLSKEQARLTAEEEE